jgi:hypothetical protein
MLRLAIGVALALLPFAVVAALLVLAERRQRRIALRYARQVAVTDAIHRELGPVAAPTVERRSGGGWRIVMQAPADRPALVGALVAIADRAAAGWDGGGRRTDIVITPQADFTGQARRAA